MSMTIYYFTGTGNSLHVARSIADQLGESNLINIAGQKGPDVIEDKSDMVGIVFPVFYLNAPVIVQDFVKKLKLDPDAYVFGIATCGGRPGNSLQTLDNLLKANGGHLAAGFILKMVGNAYIGMNFVTPLDERDQVQKSSEDGIKNIVETLKKRAKGETKFNYSIGSGLMGGMSSAIAADLYRLPRRFNTTDKCTGCDICEKICPASNIKQVDKKVMWGDHCTHCLACFHWCPQSAIEIGKKSADIARYHHPAIKVSDLIK
jgi:Pyruvate/2-oxoacid:ferredoxin oxidoreductase delta subunit/flavodoxin